jgi:pimeloyl-ACP methyl ester carboxylesterase
MPDAYTNISRREWLDLILIHSGILFPGVSLAFAVKATLKQNTMETMKINKVRSKDGTEIAYWRSGSGPPLVLIHGTTADHTRWAPVLPPLEDEFTVFAIDRRGRGESGDSTFYELQREFEDVAAVVDSISEPVNLLGHSYGAICCLEAALLTTNIQKLILYEPPIPTEIPIYPLGVLDRIQKYIDQNEFETALITFFREVVQVPEPELEFLRSLPIWKVRVAAAYTIPREMRGAEDYIFEEERFKNLTFSTGFLLGGDSPPIFKNAIERMQATIPNSRIYSLPGQQHTAMNTAPELFIKTVLDFLSESF